MKSTEVISLVNNQNDIILVYPAELITSEILKKMFDNSNHRIGLALPSTLELDIASDKIDERRFSEPFTLKSEDYGLPIVEAVHTIQSLINEDSQNQYETNRGLVYPIKTCYGGSLVLPDIPEVSFDLMNIAGFKKGAIFCYLSSTEESQFIKELKEQAICIDQVIEYRLQFESLVDKTLELKLPTEYGEFELTVYKNKFDKNNNVNLALSMGKITQEQVPLVRVHSEWSVGNIINRLSNEKGSYLNLAMKKIAQNNIGVIILIYNTPDKATQISLFSDDKAPADIWFEEGRYKTLQVYQNSMSLGLGSQILRDLGVRKMNLLTNSDKSFDGISHYGLEIVQRVRF